MPLERTIIRNIRAAVGALGCYCIKTHGAVYGEAGMPDLLILVRREHLYPTPIFVEVKVPSKWPTPLQEKRLRDLRSYGALAFVAWSVEDVVEVVKAVQQNRHVHRREVRPASSAGRGGKRAGIETRQEKEYAAKIRE